MTGFSRGAEHRPVVMLVLDIDGKELRESTTGGSAQDWSGRTIARVLEAKSDRSDLLNAVSRAALS